MKKPLLLIVTLSTALFSFGQFGTVTNGAMENWSTNTLYENPDIWETGNWEAGLQQTTTLKSTDAQNGSFAARLESKVVGNDSLFGYVINGSFDTMPDGGFAYTDVVDTLKGWYKYDLQGNDSATILMVMFNADTATEMIAQLITGTQSSWTQFAIPFNAGLVAPDSMLVAFASSNAFAETIEDGSYLMVDNLSFASSTVSNPAPIPNGDFENWSDVTAEDPDDWTTWNSLIAQYGAAVVEKTTDAHSGTYAAQITTLPWGPDTLPGVLTNGTLSEFGIDGGVPYIYEPTSFHGYYKYQPQGTDTAFILIQFSENSNQVAGNNEVITTATSSYTQFNLPLSFSAQPDSMIITIWSGENPGSELKVDSLELTGGNVVVEEVLFGNTKLTTYPNPATDVVTATFNLQETSAIQLQLIDMQGKTVMNQHYGTLPAGTQNIRLDVSSLSSGTYFVKLKGSKETIGSKITVQ